MKASTPIVRPLVLASAFALCAFALTGCDSKSSPPSAPAGGATAGSGSKPAAGGEAHHEHEDEGPTTELGAATIGAYSVTASRGEGAIKPGEEMHIDIAITGGSAKVNAVRVWVGTQDGKGSVKAKAEIEDPKEPTGWHAHAEAPSPMPAGSQLWIEIEAVGGVKAVGSFDLKT